MTYVMFYNLEFASRLLQLIVNQMQVLLIKVISQNAKLKKEMRSILNTVIRNLATLLM